MKVAYITVNFPLPSETFACTDVRVLRELGVEITVHTMRTMPRRAAALLAERGIADVTVNHNSIGSTLRGLAHALRSPHLLLETLAWLVRYTWRTPVHLARSFAVLPRSFDILAALEHDAPDVVHLFWGHYPAIVGRLVQRSCPQIVCSMFLGAYDLTRGYGPTTPVARAADVLWTHARRNVSDLAALGIPIEKVAVAYRGVDLRLFGRTKTVPVPGRIVSAGRLVRDKHVDQVIAAFRIVRQHCPHATLTVFGDGPDRARLERLAEDLRVAGAATFRGHVPHHVVRDELGRAEALVAMSREEGDRLANVVKEAMASGCVPVVAETPGIEELVEDAATGFVVPPGDVDAAAARLVHLLRHRDVRSRMGARGAQHIRAFFDVRQTMARYVSTWTRLLQTHAADAAIPSSPPAAMPLR